MYCIRHVQTEWLKSSEIRNEIKLDVYQIMPNHFHGIVIIQNGAMDRDRSDRPIAPTSLMSGFQSSVTSKINKSRGTYGTPVWQRNYVDRSIRNDEELNRFRKYIIENPMKWDLDKENTNNRKENK